ncbi:MAG: class I SAM-dependent methyltransferase [bacterium]
MQKINLSQNKKKFQNLINNPIKQIDKIQIKNKLERNFWDDWSEKFYNDNSDNLASFYESYCYGINERYFVSLLDNISGKTVLEVGCGIGLFSIYCAGKKASVTGTDISMQALNISKKGSRVKNVDKLTTFAQMSAEELGFKSNTFDVIVGHGVLHHFEPHTAAREFERVLKPGGMAIFKEPFGESRSFLFLRGLMPIECRESPGGSIITTKEIKIFKKIFKKIKIRRSAYLFERLGRIQKLDKYRMLLSKWDYLLSSIFPYVSKISGKIIIVLKK